MDLYVAQLQGYIKALERLCGNGFSFGVVSMPVEYSIDSSITAIVDKWNEYEECVYRGHTEIGFRELSKHIEKIVFNGVLANEKKDGGVVDSYLSRMIIEDISEYYGLASTALDPDGVFHPLIKSPVYKIDIINKKEESSLYYLVKIGGFLILTYFRKIKK